MHVNDLCDGRVGEEGTVLVLVLGAGRFWTQTLNPLTSNLYPHPLVVKLLLLRSHSNLVALLLTIPGLDARSVVRTPDL